MLGKFGILGILTVMNNVLVDAHCPALGVKVYKPLAVLLTVAGDHVPEMPSLDTSGNVGAMLPAQNGGGVEKTGVGLGVTDVVNVCVDAHWLATGVNV
jgi:hypothetical protein